MAKWILEAVGLRMSFGDREVLHTDRLTVSDGDRIGLIGENGAGKSTLLNILAGRLEPDEGMVRSTVPAALICQQGSAEPDGDREIKAGAAGPFRRRNDAEPDRRRAFGSFPAAAGG